MTNILFSVFTPLILVIIYMVSMVFNLMNYRIFLFFGNSLGQFLNLINFRKKIITENLNMAFGQEKSQSEIKELIKNNYLNVGITFLEILRNFSLTKKQLETEVYWPQLDLIKSYIKNNKGILFLSAHSGNWEIMASSAPLHFPVCAVVKKIHNPLAQALIEKKRTSTGLDLIYRGGTINKMKQKLGQGFSIGFMIDQHMPGKRGIRVNFFGTPASFIRGLTEIHRSTNCTFIPGVSVRQKNGTYKVLIGEPVSFIMGTNGEENSSERKLEEDFINTQNYANVIEELIRTYPEQWLWIHRRWKADRTPLPTDRPYIAAEQF